MATEDHTELPSGGSELENVENELYNDVNITATSITSEKNGEAFQTSLEDNAEEVNANAALEIEAKISTTLVERHEKVDELGDSNVENDKKVEAVISSSNKETKKVVRKRKKNVEEVSTHSVSSPPKTVKKKGNDVSSLKIKEVPPRDKSTEENDKKEVTSDDKLESLGKAEDEVEKADDKDVKIGKKVEETVNKAVKIAKKKIVAKAKGESSNAVSAPTSSPNVAAVEAACRSEEDAKQIVKDDEVNLASTAKDSIPAIEEKDAEGTKDKPTPVATEKHLKKDHTAEKRSKKVDGMGLIFMCNGKTKKDCFKYNVFGLPESKKALVAKIYKGMRLFLFDFDLKLLYGIYKAASPGGYNIEPKAFNSKFPSQVRFTVLRDSIPLPEEKFKAAIKENYTRNKFDCQLSPEQVRKLCKLFQGAAAGGSMRPGALDEAVMLRSRAREPKRRHVRREAYPSPPPRIRHLSPPPRIRHLSPPPPRARYLSPPRRGLPLQPLPRPLPAPLQPPYAYERPGDEYYYRREHLSVLDLEMRPRGHLPIGYHDAYSLYREPVLHHEPAAYPPSEPAAYPPSLPSAYGARLFREPRSPPRYLY